MQLVRVPGGVLDRQVGVSTEPGFGARMPLCHDDSRAIGLGDRGNGAKVPCISCVQAELKGKRRRQVVEPGGTNRPR